MGDVLPRVCLVPPYIDWAIVKADCFRLRPHKDVLPEYLAYILSAPQTRRRASTEIAGIGRPRLNLRKVSALEIPVPPQAEQERIVDAIEQQFSRLDAAEKILQRTQLSLTRLRFALSKEGIEAGFPTKTLQEICESLTDGDHQPPPQVPEGVPFLVIGNVRTGNVDFTGCRHVPLSYYQGLESKRRPRRGDVLYTVVGSYGIPVLVADGREFCVQRHIAILRPTPSIDAAYLMQVLRTPSVKQQADSYATGTAQKTVPLSGLRRIRVPVPPLEEQRRISKILQEWDTQISRLSSEIQRQLQRSINLRTSILEAAFSGKLT
jgi:type I restriction enzyme, S subunit